MTGVVTVVLGVLLSSAALVQAADVYVDFGGELRINGERRFDRSRYVAFHETVPSDNSDEEIRYLHEDLRITGGRGMFGPASSDPSFEDAPSLAKMRTAGRDKVERLSDVYQVRRFDQSDKIVSDDAWTFEMARNRYQSFTNHARRYFRHFFDDDLGVYRPRMYEVLNEAQVKASLFGQNTVEVIREQARMTDIVCRGIHAEFGTEMQCGGPCSAWPFLHGGNFAVFEEHFVNFFEIAGGSSDFISTHMYNMQGHLLEAILDLLDSFYWNRFGRPARHLISEYGATHKTWIEKSEDRRTKYAQGSTPAREFYIIHHTLATFMDLLQRPDRIYKSTMFISGRASWSYVNSKECYPWALLCPDRNGVYRWNHLRKIFQVLKDVDGQFRENYSTDSDLQTFAVYQGGVGYLLVHNLRAARIPIRFRYGSGMQLLRQAQLTRLFLNEGPLTEEDILLGLQRGGAPVLATQPPTRSAPSSLTIRPEEMLLLEFSFRSEVPVTANVRRTVHYASSYLKTIAAGERVTFEVPEVPTPRGGRAVVKIGVARPKSRGWIPRSVRINGHDVDLREVKLAGPDLHTHWMIFGVYKLAFPLSFLRYTNQVEVVYAEVGGWVSSVVLEVDREDRNVPDPTPTPTPDVVPWRNVMRNPGFENGSGGRWNLAQEAYITSRFKRTGARAVRLPSGRAFAYQYVPVEINTRYEFSAHLYAEGNDNQVSISLRVTGQEPIYESTGSTGTWERVATVFNSGATTMVRVAVFATVGNKGYADDVVLRKV